MLSYRQASDVVRYVRRGVSLDAAIFAATRVDRRPDYEVWSQARVRLTLRAINNRTGEAFLPGFEAWAWKTLKLQEAALRRPKPTSPATNMEWQAYDAKHLPF